MRSAWAALAGAIALAASGAADAQGAPGPIRVSSDGTRFEDASGRPFFWLADTAWDLAYRTTPEELERYLDTRARQGFTVVQVAALSENDGIRTPTDRGRRPFLDGDPTRPDPVFFDHLAELVDEAAERGLHVALLPTWGDKLTAPWGVGPRLFTLENLPVAEGYGRFLAERLCGKRNLVWMLGGDRPAHLNGPSTWWVLNAGREAGFPEGHDWRPIWRAMAKGLLEARCDAPKPLIGYHPQGGSEGTAFMLPDEPWLDFHGLQSGHGGGRDSAGWAWIARDRSAGKPVVDLEINYEDHPVNPWPTWDPASGRFDDHDVRKQAWRTVFAGAAGVTYGHHAVWQFAGPRHPGINHADRGWEEALTRPGAEQMRHLRTLMESRWEAGVRPAPELLPSNPAGGADRAEALAAPDGRWALVYVPRSGAHLDTTSLGPKRFSATWLDPRTGRRSASWEISSSRTAVVTPVGGPDWVLVLEALGS